MPLLAARSGRGLVINIVLEVSDDPSRPQHAGLRTMLLMTFRELRSMAYLLQTCSLKKKPNYSCAEATDADYEWAR